MPQPNLTPELTSAFTELVEIIARLRQECPWDMKQTHESLREPLIEEAYEAIEAIDNKDYPELKKELGDLMLHIIFHSDLAAEAKTFTLEDLIRGESAKLIYRHPHVFGEVKVSGADEVSLNWEQLKRKESGRTSVLDGVPAIMPALQRASRIQDKAAKVGFDWNDPQSVLNKVREELDEYVTEVDPIKKQEEFGDLLFSLVNYSRHVGIESETALREATQKFERRFRQVEQKVEASAKSWSEYSLEELDQFWNAIKSLEQ